ncbi:NAD(P)H-hydrate dehydratase [Sphingorhabdus arenilitoris]|uniref:ADP-dependent (S)-NAD(P)H-hydrate dehydratase n=1 Tax=Sphingorhabdus arenilitoris TaxID=1490041 RepID=A0ABV8RFB0_9SPHN
MSLDQNNIIGKPEITAPSVSGNKYDRGWAVVFSGPPLRTGASRLSAQAALSVGAGLVTIMGAKEALQEQSAHVSAIMLAERSDDLHAIDSRVTSLAIGPAYGIGERCRADVLVLAGQGRLMVIDADAITAFAKSPATLFTALHDQIVLTPHDGEFARLFPDISLSDRLHAVTAAAQRSGAVILLKGPQSVIAAPDGRIAINTHSSPWLATAGSGDVLTGIICGIMAQGVGGFRAACCAAWLHGDIAVRFGAGLTADLMVKQIPMTLADLGPAEQG